MEGRVLHGDSVHEELQGTAVLGTGCDLWFTVKIAVPRGIQWQCAEATLVLGASLKQVSEEEKGDPMQW